MSFAIVSPVEKTAQMPKMRRHRIIVRTNMAPLTRIVYTELCSIYRTSSGGFEIRKLAQEVATSKAPAVARAAAILRLLGKSSTPLGVQAIARDLGLVPSTCLYVLRALADEELIAFDPDTKRYSLDVGVLTLARQWLRRSRFADLSRPILESVSRDLQISTLGVQVVGLDHIVVVTLAQSEQPFQLSARVGSRFPALISATGRCVAAFGEHSSAELRAAFLALRWDEPPDFSEWLADVEETRAAGFAVDEGNYISGVTVVSAPVFAAPGRLNHAIVAIGIDSVLRRVGVTRVASELVAAANTLSRQLSGSD